jgi:hypothetical protein
MHGEHWRNGSPVAPAGGSFDPKGMQVARALAQRHSGSIADMAELDTPGASCNPDKIGLPRGRTILGGSVRILPHRYNRSSPKGTTSRLSEDVASVSLTIQSFYREYEIPQCGST